MPKWTPQWTPQWTLVAAVVLTLPTLALAQQVQRMLSLTINGQTVTEKAVVIGGKAYIPVSSLKQYGFSATQSGTALTVTAPRTASSGGANQLAALEGCLNESLFNGVYRLRVLKTEALTSPAGKPQQMLTVELRNGTQDTLSPTQAGFDGVGAGILLEDDQGTQLSLSPSGYQLDNGGIFKALPRAGGFTTRWTFNYPNGIEASRMGTLSKLLVPIKINQWQRHAPKDSKIADPSFRVNLTCTK